MGSFLHVCSLLPCFFLHQTNGFRVTARGRGRDGWRARCLKLVKKAILGCAATSPLRFLAHNLQPLPRKSLAVSASRRSRQALVFFRWLAVASFKVMSVSSSIGACAPCPRFRVGGSMRDTVRPCASAHMEQRRPELYSSAHPPQIFH